MKHNDIRAFPGEGQIDPDVPPENDYLQTGIYSGKFPGMTLRDYFANTALDWTLNHDHGNDYQQHGKEHIPRAASLAYKIADAMLEERLK